MVILTEKFRFIRNDVFLCPEVDTETGRQQVKMQKIDDKTGKIEFEEKFSCIHVCITSITPDEHERYYSDPEFHEKFDEISLNIRSSANLKEIDLNPEEKFVALKSWAEGITEAGMDAFMVQNNIDLASGITAPLTGTLIRFMLKVDAVFLQDYIDFVKRTYSVDGVIHKTSFVANFLSLLEDIRNQNFIWDEYPSIDTIISSILDPDPSPLLFREHLELLYLRDLIEPGFLNGILVKFKKIQTAQEFSMTLKNYFDQIIDRFNSNYHMDIEFLNLTKFEREVIVLGMKDNSNSIRREISKSYLETTCLLEFLIYDFDYFNNNNFEILTEIIKGAPNDVIPFQKITEKIIDEYSKEDSHISEMLSNPRIKEPITALLRKNPPISIFSKESYLLFFNAVYNNNNLHEVCKKLISLPDEDDQVRKIFTEILKTMSFYYDDYYWAVNSYFNKEYATYFVNLLDEILQSPMEGSIPMDPDYLRSAYSYAALEQEMIDRGKKFGVEMSGENVYTIITFNENFKDSLKLKDLKNISVVQKHGLILEWENEKYLVLNNEYDFYFSKYNLDDMDGSYLSDPHQTGHYGYWKM